MQLPSTMQAIVAARIDRLAPDEKALLQQLAVIGREFPLSLVGQVLLQPETELYRLLTSLQGKEFLYEQPAFLKSDTFHRVYRLFELKVSGEFWVKRSDQERYDRLANSIPYLSGQ